MVFDQIILTTTPGLESLLIDELAEFSVPALSYAVGAVVCEQCSVEDLLFLNYASRLTHAVYIGLGKTQIPLDASKDDIKARAEALVAEMAFSFWEAEALFCVRAYRRGHQTFTSLDVEQSFAGALNRRRQALVGSTWRAHLKEPTFAFDVFVNDQDVWLGLSTTGADLRNRISLPFVHYAPLDRVLAAGLLRVSQLTVGDAVLDPMCGGGNILLEAIDLIRGDAPQRRRSQFAFLQHPYFQNEIWEAAKTRYISHTLPLKLWAADRFGGKVSGLQENLRAYEAEAMVQVHVGSAAHMDYIDAGVVNKIVVNPPYGVRISNTKEVSSLYTAFAKCSASKQIQQVVAITPRHKTWDDALHAAGYQRSLFMPVVYGDMPAFVTRHELV